MAQQNETRHRPDHHPTGTVLSVGSIATTDGTVIGALVEMDVENARAAVALVGERVVIAPVGALHPEGAVTLPASALEHDALVVGGLRRRVAELEAQLAQPHPSAVPVEPTEDQRDAGRHAFTVTHRYSDTDDSLAAVYRAMVSAAPPAPSAWRPIETAPKTRDDFTGGTVEILGWIPDDTAPKGGNRETVWWEPKLGDGGKGAWWFCGDHEVHPTHWMPLPAPPAPAEEG